eukprot:TRINITY_DN7678_c0_g1_i2.p2 TRINITY_DN7678_c0_g1~~TRINITY_DN7678_c0_g1_i2.p2  ORF type:complete len:239 (-),score=36.09 TRINITY_DN7678_c0_g1_i2:770-1486(-)
MAKHSVRGRLTWEEFEVQARALCVVSERLGPSERWLWRDGMEENGEKRRYAGYLYREEPFLRECDEGAEHGAEGERGGSGLLPSGEEGKGDEEEQRREGEKDGSGHTQPEGEKMLRRAEEGRKTDKVADNNEEEDSEGFEAEEVLEEEQDEAALPHSVHARLCFSAPRSSTAPPTACLCSTSLPPLLTASPSTRTASIASAPPPSPPPALPHGASFLKASIRNKAFLAFLFTHATRQT